VILTHTSTVGLISPDGAGLVATTSNIQVSAMETTWRHGSAGVDELGGHDHDVARNHGIVAPVIVATLTSWLVATYLAAGLWSRGCL
jgi:hypothetical protein